MDGLMPGVRFFDSATAMRDALARLSNADVARVSPDFPLRANLSALENIALIPLFRDKRTRRASQAIAMQLLDALGYARIASLRDPDLDPSGRFVVKLARALVVGTARAVIDQPGAMLFDVAYPDFIETCMRGLGERGGPWEVYDFAWNRPLYPPSWPAS
jgi:predicted ABC-type transport system involved in lysophospholipase L1 biosynthesis ATPase subunit